MIRGQIRGQAAKIECGFDHWQDTTLNEVRSPYETNPAVPDSSFTHTGYRE
ncbi:hypothetical protein SAMN05216337_101037 [Bradyrhizobium brasilense]|uniref:Uncharacterized protein n=1 Tax=Bradyrhizobium brasilense TaxID=1419277 RepID=A0A1G6TWV6_9BRAD|nr:hypothetical protein SAMN05216337_101037 [Bradyrhizobium brasilense]